MASLGQHRNYLIGEARRFFGLAQFGAGGDKDSECRKIGARDLAYRYARCN